MVERKDSVCAECRISIQDECPNTCAGCRHGHDDHGFSDSWDGGCRRCQCQAFTLGPPKPQETSEYDVSGLMGNGDYQWAKGLHWTWKETGNQRAGNEFMSIEVPRLFAHSDAQASRIRELERRLYEETQRRRESERSKP